MALETGTVVNDLVITNPPSGDPKSQGDDHIRLLKTVIKNTFPGFTGSVIVTATDSGAANAYVLTPTVALSSYTAGLLVAFIPTVANTGASTINISGLGTKNIKGSAGNDPINGALAAGKPILLQYDGTQFEIVGITQAELTATAFVGTLPSQTGNAGKFVKTDGSNASWSYLPTQNGTTTGTGLVTLTQGGAYSITPSTYGQYVTLPDATTLVQNSNIISIYNAGDYDYGIRDAAGNQLGWIHSKTSVSIGLASISTAAGVWVIPNIARVALTGQLFVASQLVVASSLKTVAIDSNRTMVLFATSTSIVAQVYDKSSQSWGASAVVRSAGTNPGYAAILSAANQVLVVSGDGTNVQGVTLTVATTTITVNSASSNVTSNGVNFGNMVAVGSSFVVVYGKSASSVVLALTISGTTVTIGAETNIQTVVNAAPVIFATSATVCLVLCGDNTNLNINPYTISAGTTITLGTATTQAYTGTTASMKAFAVGTRWMAVYNTGSLIQACLISVAAAVATKTVATAINASVNFDAGVISSSKVFVAGGSSGVFNIVTDSAGTASAGTTLTTGTTGSQSYILSLSSTVARVTTSTPSVHVIDISGASPAFLKHMSIAAGMTPASSLTQLGTRQGNVFNTSSASVFLSQPSSNGAITITSITDNGFSVSTLIGQLPSTSVDRTAGQSNNESWYAVSTGTGTNLQRLEAA